MSVVCLQVCTSTSTYLVEARLLQDLMDAGSHPLQRRLLVAHPLRQPTPLGGCVCVYVCVFVCACVVLCMCVCV